MIKQQAMIGTLTQLQRLRARKVEELSSQLAQQKQLVLRYHDNISALSQLSAGPAAAAEQAAHLRNRATYKAHIQRVIHWQQQAAALAEKQQQQLQCELLTQACREKTVELVRNQQQQALTQAQARQQQNVTDAQATQCWLRQRGRGA